MSVRVRFPPSPTGFLHLGGARTALFNWLFAKANHGTFVFRIEDTDRTRYVPEAEADILTSLRWLGMDWDEGPEKGGNFGPYHQSQRLEIYKKYAHSLLEKGAAYRCFCSAERLEQMREAQKAQKQNPGYDRLCRNLPPQEAEDRVRAGERHVIRLKVPTEGKTSFHDQIRGEIEYDNTALDDLVLFKTDGFPTYHLANVVDDHSMEITHVLRGDEWISSTPRHVLLYQALGWTMPVFAHLPLILAPDGGKLSKRHGATSVVEYRKAGYLPEALFNFLVLLGFSPGNDREILTPQEMAEAFTLDRISPKAAVFDVKKLDWMNGHYLQHANAGTLAEHLRSYWTGTGITEAGLAHADYNEKVVGLFRTRAKTLKEMAETSVYLFRDPAEYEANAARKYFNPKTAAILRDLAGKMNGLTLFDANSLEIYFKEQAEARGVLFADLIHPTRLAVSGVSGGPGLFELLAVLGKEKVIRRMEKACVAMEQPGSPA